MFPSSASAGIRSGGISSSASASASSSSSSSSASSSSAQSAARAPAKPTWTSLSHPSRNPIGHVPRLDELVVRAVAENYHTYPVLDQLPAEYVEAVIHLLDPSKISFVTAATYITDERFWRKLYLSRWSAGAAAADKQQGPPEKHGNSWKRAFVERHVNELLEAYYPSREHQNFQRLMAELEAAQPFVFSVQVQQLLPQLDLARVLGGFPHLATLDLKYGAKDIGMDYDKTLFGAKVSSMLSLARLLSQSKTVARLSLRENLLSDECLQVLNRGLADNDTLTHLDLAHNALTDAGARHLARLLTTHPVLMHLDLSDNGLHEEGALALADALAANRSLRALDLSLNRLGDRGAAAVLHALVRHPALASLSLSACELGPLAAKALLELLRCNRVLTRIDLSCNELGAAAGQPVLDLLLKQEQAVAAAASAARDGSGAGAGAGTAASVPASMTGAAHAATGAGAGEEAGAASAVIELDLNRNGVPEAAAAGIRKVLFQRHARAKQALRKAFQVGWDDAA